MTTLIAPSRLSSHPQSAAPHVYRLPTGISNAYLVALDNHDFLLVDAGQPGYADRILAAAHQFFGHRPPRAILLTHAHFDHAGGLPALLHHWPHTSVYAHPLDLPYLNHNKRFPPGDPTVGGFMANLSRFLDTAQPTPLHTPVKPLPEEGGPLHFMPGWEIYPTPGHTPGHVSFWNPAQRILIAGDAVVTLKQSSALATLMQSPIISQPPPYATYNWHHARQSARLLADLEPLYLCTGHGLPIHGPSLPDDLKHFAAHFPTPSHGRYVHTAARFNRNGPVYIPPAPFDTTKYATLAAGLTGLTLAAYLLCRNARSSSGRKPGA